MSQARVALVVRARAASSIRVRPQYELDDSPARGPVLAPVDGPSVLANGPARKGADQVYRDRAVVGGGDLRSLASRHRGGDAHRVEHDHLLVDGPATPRPLGEVEAIGAGAVRAVNGLSGPSARASSKSEEQ